MSLVIWKKADGRLAHSKNSYTTSTFQSKTSMWLARGDLVRFTRCSTKRKSLTIKTLDSINSNRHWKQSKKNLARPNCSALVAHKAWGNSKNWWEAILKWFRMAKSLSMSLSKKPDLSLTAVNRNARTRFSKTSEMSKCRDLQPLCQVANQVFTTRKLSAKGENAWRKLKKPVNCLIENLKTHLQQIQSLRDPAPPNTCSTMRSSR